MICHNCINCEETWPTESNFVILDQCPIDDRTLEEPKCSPSQLNTSMGIPSVKVISNYRGPIAVPLNKLEDFIKNGIIEATTADNGEPEWKINEDQYGLVKMRQIVEHNSEMFRKQSSPVQQCCICPRSQENLPNQEQINSKLCSLYGFTIEEIEVLKNLNKPGSHNKSTNENQSDPKTISVKTKKKRSRKKALSNIGLTNTEGDVATTKNEKEVGSVDVCEVEEGTTVPKTTKKKRHRKKKIAIQLPEEETSADTQKDSASVKEHLNSGNDLVKPPQEPKSNVIKKRKRSKKKNKENSAAESSGDLKEWQDVTKNTDNLLQIASEIDKYYSNGVPESDRAADVQTLRDHSLSSPVRSYTIEQTFKLNDASLDEVTCEETFRRFSDLNLNYGYALFDSLPNLSLLDNSLTSTEGENSDSNLRITQQLSKLGIKNNQNELSDEDAMSSSCLNTSYDTESGNSTDTSDEFNGAPAVSDAVETWAQVICRKIKRNSKQIVLDEMVTLKKLNKPGGKNKSTNGHQSNSNTNSENIKKKRNLEDIPPNDGFVNSREATGDTEENTDCKITKKDKLVKKKSTVQLPEKTSGKCGDSLYKNEQLRSGNISAKEQAESNKTRKKRSKKKNNENFDVESTDYLKKPYTGSMKRTNKLDNADVMKEIVQVASNVDRTYCRSTMDSVENAILESACKTNEELDVQALEEHPLSLQVTSNNDEKETYKLDNTVFNNGDLSFKSNENTPDEHSDDTDRLSQETLKNNETDSSDDYGWYMSSPLRNTSYDPEWGNSTDTSDEEFNSAAAASYEVERWTEIVGRKNKRNRKPRPKNKESNFNFGEDDIYAMKVHGILIDSENSDSGRDEFDEMYYSLMPPPCNVDPSKIVVIEEKKNDNFNGKSEKD
ncbi:dentin sialophosphoprotein isoform X2 [Aethina tumida]|nr:dentin sialophosphoprotein isoform X2 [Aethina tumida]XP_049819818.1 dentin sialophosphoprotein isoform X2 [Aethina tumida]XP_049819819.1 dentin sialophosphoprotein isoform X2 [Aethina tumida]